MSHRCGHCKIGTATQRCHLCSEGHTCAKKACEIAFQVTHICNKSKRARDEGAVGFIKSPDLLQTLFMRYKDVIPTIISHLDNWRDVKNICNVDQTMRQACSEFKQLSGGIWQFLLKLYFPFTADFPEFVRDMRDREWPAWARAHPYVYFRAFLLAVYLKFGTLDNNEDMYENQYDEIVSIHQSGWNRFLQEHNSIRFRSADGKKFFLLVVAHVTEDYNHDATEDDDDLFTYTVQHSLKFENYSASDDLAETFARHFLNGSMTTMSVDLTPMMNEDGDYVDGFGTASLESLIDFLYEIWTEDGYQWETFADIPKNV